MLTVYKATAPDGKSYIGCTNNLTRRKREWGGEQSAYRKGMTPTWADAVRTWGLENVVVETLSEHVCALEAAKAEAAAIILHNSMSPSGYNHSCHAIPNPKWLKNTGRDWIILGSLGTYDWPPQPKVTQPSMFDA